MALYTLLFFSIFPLVFSNCPNGTIASLDPTICYNFSLNAKSFFDAEKLCKDYFGHLTSVKDVFTNAYIFNQSQKAFGAINMVDYWLGGIKDNTTAKWSWVDGANFVYHNWAQGEPQTNEDSLCISQYLNTGKWSGQTCANQKQFVCETPAILCDPCE